MTKEETLESVRILAADKALTREELNAAYDAGTGARGFDAAGKKLSIAAILYYIGAAIVYIGIVILLVENWMTLNFATRLIVSLGAGVAAYIVGTVLQRDARTELASPGFYLIAALTTPIGLYVLFDKIGFDTHTAGVSSLIAVIMLGACVFSFYASRKSVFVLFSILFATWLFFSLTDLMVEGNPSFGWKFYEYRTLICGIAYAFLGYSFIKGRYASLSGFLYGFGALGFLGAALALGGWKPDQTVFWELIYPVLIFGALYLSVFLKSKSFLTFGTIFLMLYILKITSEYFTNGLGWPLALVIAGLGIVGAGYVSVALNRKYIAAQAAG